MEILCERANLNAAQNSLTMNVDQFMGHLAERYRVSEEAVRVFAPSLGARGWSAGAVLTSRTWRLRTVDAGMTQIGDMFNYELRDRVERFCQELTILPTVNMNPCWPLFPNGLLL